MILFNNNSLFIKLYTLSAIIGNHWAISNFVKMSSNLFPFIRVCKLEILKFMDYFLSPYTSKLIASISDFFVSVIVFIYEKQLQMTFCNSTDVKMFNYM